MLHVRVERLAVKAPVENVPFSVVVATPVVKLELVPQAKPLTVAEAPPVAVMLPLRVAVVCPVTEAL